MWCLRINIHFQHLRNTSLYDHISTKANWGDTQLYIIGSHKFASLNMEANHHLRGR